MIVQTSLAPSVVLIMAMLDMVSPAEPLIFIVAPVLLSVMVRAVKSEVSYRSMVLRVLGRSSGVSVPPAVTVRKSYVPEPPRIQPVVMTTWSVTSAVTSMTNSARAPATSRMAVTSAASER